MKILLVNLPPERGKRSHFGRLSFQRGTNYGLLALASALADREHDVTIFDPQLWPDPSEREVQYKAVLCRSDWDLVGFSCISGFSYPSLITWASLARDRVPGAYLIAGGQDHVGRMPSLALDECRALDAVVCGEGEPATLALLDSLQAGTRVVSVPGVVTRDAPVSMAAAQLPHVLPSMRYHLYPDHKRFPASVEFARGCPFECSFCISAKSGLRRRTPDALIREIQNVHRAYAADGPLPIYFEAPIFAASRNYLLELRQGLSSLAVMPIWRTESRVDAISVDIVPLLWDCGLRVIDLGLESASPNVLRLMNKTTNPALYLAKASKLLRELSAYGIFSKVNILFYAGETPESLAETKSFLDAHRDSIGAVAAYPLMMYPGIEDAERIQAIVVNSGGSFVEDEIWRSRHLVPVNASRHYSYEDLIEIAHAWEQDFQTPEKYYYQRHALGTNIV